MTSAHPDHILIHGDARKIPLADGSVHCCACSPPFFGLRDYGTGRWEGGDPACDHRVAKLKSRYDYAMPDSAQCGTHKGMKEGTDAARFRDVCPVCGARRVDRQIGLEPTVEAFVAAIVAVGREVWRVLRDDGNWWINLGDSMSSKDLCLIPERCALALQSDGWVVRAKPPWVKPSPMPESTTDRPNVAHESIFLLTKGSRYFFDMEAVRVPNQSSGRGGFSNKSTSKWATAGGIMSGGHPLASMVDAVVNPAGRHLRTNDFFTASLDAAIEHHEAQLAHLRRIKEKGGLLSSEAGDPLALWVGSQIFNGAHFAVWPERLVRWMVKASTSEKGCCAACGAPLVREVEKRRGPIAGRLNPKDEAKVVFRVNHDVGRTTGLKQPGWRQHPVAATKTLDWRPSCRCNSPLPPQPCTVLDPFCGSGTTLLTALSMGRRAVGVDLNREYLGMATGRIAAGLRPASRYDPERPKKPLDGQLSLFDDPTEEEVIA